LDHLDRVPLDLSIMQHWVKIQKVQDLPKLGSPVHKGTKAELSEDKLPRGVRFGQEGLRVGSGKKLEHQGNVQVGGVEVGVNAVIDSPHPERSASRVLFPFHNVWPEDRWDMGRAEHGMFAVSAAEVGEMNQDKLFLLVASIGSWGR
jgi:hypothetical protein